MISLLVACTGIQAVPGKDDSGSDTGETPVSDGFLQASDSVVDFGAVLVGTEASVPLTLTNTGNGVLAVDLYTKGDDAFAISTGTVQLETDLVVTISFLPGALSDYSGSLVVDAGVDGRVEINLLGSGTDQLPSDDSGDPPNGAPDITVTPTSYDFGQVDTGTTVSTSFTVYNNGDQALLVSNLTFGDTAFSNIGGSLQLPQSIDPGKNKSFVVEFAPTQEKNYSTNATLESDDPNSPNFKVTLSGEGVDLCNTCQPILDVDNGTGDPTTLSFGVLAGFTTDTKTITLTNLGDQDLDISRVTVTNDSISTCGDFSLSGWNSATTVSPGRSVGFDISYRASTSCIELDQSALGMNVLTIDSNDPGNSPFTMGLSAVAL
jgi:hypothetical protein